MSQGTAEALRRRASEAGKPVTRYLTDLIREDEKRYRDALAEEGYSLLAGASTRFAESALPVAAETWPEWEDGEPVDKA
ncbi:MAG TPA: hypothetical protein VFJ58_24485 [Armatimonadota bacterium]|nr:hypothetical protein [Armatimonadota bacterium]